MPNRPDVVAFDVIETMFSLENVRTRMVDSGLPPHVLELWFARMVRDGFALTTGGTYQPFPVVARSALESVLAQHGLDASNAPAILEGFSELDAHPDVEPALDLLAEAGIRIVTLSNGGAETTSTLLDRAGFASRFEQVLSVDAVQRWKPHPAPYQYAADMVGVDPGRLTLIAVHSWDIFGAKQAGLTTGWASRLEVTFPPALGQPDVAGETLPDVVRGLLDLPGN